MSRWTAFLLAGSRPDGDPLAQSMMLGHKALIPVAGEPMVLRPLRALLASPEVGNDHRADAERRSDLRPVLPDDERISHPRVERHHRRRPSPSNCADRAAEFPLLVATADHALLDSGDGRRILAAGGRRRPRHRGGREQAAARALPADQAHLDQLPRRALQRRQPVRVRLHEGASGGRRWGAVEQDRKKGWRLLAALGPALLLGAVLKLRTIHESAAAIGRKLGIAIRIVEMSNPVAAIDVDKPADHALVEAILAGRA